MVSGILNISSSIFANTEAHNRKMSLPVNPASLMFSHFQHVSGVPAPEGTQGVTISKLHLVNVLIARLSQLQANSNTQFHVNPYNGVDALIESLQAQISQLTADTDIIPYSPSPAANSGTVLNLLS